MNYTYASEKPRYNIDKALAQLTTEMILNKQNSDIKKDTTGNGIAFESEDHMIVKLNYKNQDLYYTENCQKGFSTGAGTWIWTKCSLADNLDEVNGQSEEMRDLLQELSKL